MLKTATRLTCRLLRNLSGVGDMLDELEWPFLEARGEQSSLTFFYKIHSGTVSVGREKYPSPPPIVRSGASQESKYTRYLAYGEVFIFSLELILS